MSLVTRCSLGVFSRAILPDKSLSFVLLSWFPLSARKILSRPRRDYDLTVAHRICPERVHTCLSRHLT